MSEFKQYRRTQIAELRPIGLGDIVNYNEDGSISINGSSIEISISNEDKGNGSPKIGDMIARNPKNHNDQWLVAEQYFKDNFEPLNH